MLTLTRGNRIWTHNIRGIDFHEDFKCNSCATGNDTKPQMAATIAAGEVDKDVYQALAEHDAIVVGGANPVSSLELLVPRISKSRLADGPFRPWALWAGLRAVDTAH